MKVKVYENFISMIHISARTTRRSHEIPIGAHEVSGCMRARSVWSAKGESPSVHHCSVYSMHLNGFFLCDIKTVSENFMGVFITGQGFILHSRCDFCAKQPGTTILCCFESFFICLFLEWCTGQVAAFSAIKELSSTKLSAKLQL